MKTRINNFISRFRKPKEETKNKDQTQLSKQKQEIEKYESFLEEFGNNLEQKRAVISDSNRILVLAGAGSGKTKVLTKRFIHLVKNKNIPKDNILAVTFTKEAANEMAKRISRVLNTNPENVKANVRTFHSLCYSILKQNEQYDIISENEQREFIRNIISSFRYDKKIMESMYNYIKDNILDKVLEKDRKNNREPRIKEKPRDFGQKNIKTKSGILVRSKSERDIANFLTSLGLKWEYEKLTEWSDSSFIPDFTIEDSIYLEHWCYNSSTPEFYKINKKRYLKHREWKEDQYKNTINHLFQ